MKNTRRIAALAALIAVVGCKPDLAVPDYNASSLGGLSSGGPAAIKTATLGLLVGSRAQNALPQAAFVSVLGELGREGYSLDPSNPQTNQGRLQILEPNIASTIWQSSYRNIKQANAVLHALDTTAGFTDAEKEALRGFAKTLMALDFLVIIDMVDESGAAIDVDRDVTADPAPIVNKAAVYTQILKLLDEAKVHLGKAGTRFPMLITDGFAGFDTPLTFLMFNRALRVRVDVYAKNYATALTDLNETFISLNAPLTLGTYFVFTNNSGDATNPLFDPLPRILFGHPATEADAQKRADGTLDLRFQNKIAKIPARQSNGIAVNSAFKIYSATSSSIPIIRNEELILLRAEANLSLGNTSAAIKDINFIRVSSGGLAPISDPYNGPGTVLDELLYNRRYSLLWEGGHRWIDMRRYGRLASLPRAAPDHKVFPYMPLPEAECLPRSPKPAGCSLPAGL